ncbi:endothelin-converting enzyme-like 1 [Amblyomma americanum]
MDGIVDNSVKPCHDFYRHVCGRWIGNASLPDPLAPSFMAEVLLNYTARRHREMVARQALAEPADLVSRYYNSCISYLGVSRTIREIVDKVLEVSGIKLESWLKMSSEQTFFKLLHLSFLYRLNALFMLTAGINDNKTHLAIDRWRSFKQRLPKTDKDGQGKTYLAAVLKAIGTEGVNDAVIAQCHTLDDSIGLNETVRRKQRSPLAPTSAAECTEFPPEKWIQGTNAQEKVKLSPNTNVLARDFKATCSDLKSVLLHKTTPVGTVYPLALLAVDFLKLDFMLSTQSKQLEGELVQKVCHLDTMTTFKRLWLPALSKVLAISPDTIEAISGYFKTLKMMIEEAGVRYPKWMNIKDRITALARLKEMRISTFSNGTLSKDDLENSRFQQSLKIASEWISNKATVLERTKAPDDVDEDSTLAEDEEYLETAEVQLLADMTTNTVIVPHMFAVPPVVFSDISAGTYANLAMFGFHIARKVMSLLLGVRGVSPWSNDTASYYAAAQSCYANNSGAFHGLLGDAEFDEAVGAAFALRVVLQVGFVVAKTAPASEAPLFSMELFFRRACLSLCAGGKQRADFNSLDQDTASAACTLAVSTMDAFHRTFGCKWGDQMAAPWRCKI